MSDRLTPMPKIEPVELPQDWRDFLDSLPPNGQPHPNMKQWSPQEDAFLLEARARKATWEAICKILKTSHTTALKRYRELTDK